MNFFQWTAERLARWRLQFTDPSEWSRQSNGRAVEYVPYCAPDGHGSVWDQPWTPPQELTRAEIAALEAETRAEYSLTHNGHSTDFRSVGDQGVSVP